MVLPSLVPSPPPQLSLLAVLHIIHTASDDTYGGGLGRGYVIRLKKTHTLTINVSTEWFSCHQGKVKKIKIQSGLILGNRHRCLQAQVISYSYHEDWM